MPVNTIEGSKADLSAKVATVLQAVFTGIQDEAGNTVTATGQPYAVTVTNDDPDIVAPWPSVSIFLDIPARPAGFGLQKWDELDDGTEVFGTFAERATIHCTITARRDAERTYLADYLTYWIERAVWIDPATQIRYDGVIKLWLGTLGIVYRGVGHVEYPAPNAASARPEGEPFVAIVPILCDITVTWVGGLNAPTTIQSTQTATVDGPTVVDSLSFSA